MPPKPKSKLLPSVRVSETLYNETVDCASKASKEGEYLSEYIRKAVEMRNAQYNTFQVPVMPRDKEAAEALFNREHPPKQTSTVEQMKELEYMSGKPRPTIPELKEQVKQMESPKFCNPIPKGGK